MKFEAYTLVKKLMWVFWIVGMYEDTEVSNEHAASIFRADDGDEQTPLSSTLKIKPVWCSTEALISANKCIWRNNHTSFNWRKCLWVCKSNVRSFIWICKGTGMSSSGRCCVFCTVASSCNFDVEHRAASGISLLLYKMQIKFDALEPLRVS